MYSGSNNIDDVAWYSPEYKCLNTHIVGTRQGNELGIFDMSGNMIEFTGSSYGSYSTNLYKELAAPDDKSMRALRGGSICHDCRRSRIAYRGGQYVDSRNNDHGFRVV
jgi:formylglycine-generating enzyme required for sulfatase activity